METRTVASVVIAHVEFVARRLLPDLNAQGMQIAKVVGVRVELQYYVVVVAEQRLKMVKAAAAMQYLVFKMQTVAKVANAPVVHVAQSCRSIKLAQKMNIAKVAGATDWLQFFVRENVKVNKTITNLAR